MDNKAIETLAVNAVRDSIVLSDYLDQFIADNDKEPSWDGFVYIYSNMDKKKEHLKGRLPVQVKGKKTNDAFPEKITYPISIVDLNNYLHDGGIIFFVVYINSDSRKKQIYYSDLTPIKIRQILKSAKQQKTKNIDLLKFPEDSTHKKLIIDGCYEHCRMQASFCDSNLSSIAELAEEGILEGISIHIPTAEGVNPLDTLVENDGYLYATVKGAAIPQPIETVFKSIVATEEKTVSVSVKDRVFYTTVKIERDSSNLKMIIGESFFVIFDKKEQTSKVRYESSDSLRSRVKDLEFILSCVDNEGFSYGDSFIPLPKDDADFSNFDIEKERKSFEQLKLIVQLLDFLGCNKDLNLKSLTSDDYNNLNCLIFVFLYHGMLSENMVKDWPPVFFVKISELSFLLCILPDENNIGNYQLCDYFSSEFPTWISREDEKDFFVSQYIVLSADALLRADNYRRERLLTSFKKMDNRYESIAKANIFMLSLIEAYDVDNSRIDLLCEAENFADWLMETTEEELPYSVRILNKYQIIKRRQQLTDDQIKELYSILESATREDVKTGAYLLLDQQPAAEMHFERMGNDLQEEFKKYPIYHFWKESKGEQNG